MGIDLGSIVNNIPGDIDKMNAALDHVTKIEQSAIAGAEKLGPEFDHAVGTVKDALQTGASILEGLAPALQMLLPLVQHFFPAPHAAAPAPAKPAGAQ